MAMMSSASSLAQYTSIRCPMLNTCPAECHSLMAKCHPSRQMPCFTPNVILRVKCHPLIAKCHPVHRVEHLPRQLSFFDRQMSSFAANVILWSPNVIRCPMLNTCPAKCHSLIAKRHHAIAKCHCLIAKCHPVPHVEHLPRQMSFFDKCHPMTTICHPSRQMSYHDRQMSFFAPNVILGSPKWESSFWTTCWSEST